MSVQELLKHLSNDATDAGIARVCSVVEEWAHAGRVADLVALATALETTADARDATDYEVVVDHVEVQLALTPGDRAIDALLALSLDGRTRTTAAVRPPGHRARTFASRLGYGQKVEDFLAALGRVDRVKHRELLACWMHEIVLRGTSLARANAAVAFRDEIGAEGHPLAVLPLVLGPVEREAPSYMPLYGDRGLTRAIEALTSGPMSGRSIPPPAHGVEVSARPLEDAELTERLGAAVAPWTASKAGKLEAKAFALTPAIETSLLGSWLLRALPLASIEGAARVDCERLGADGVYGPLFAAASNGGAASNGFGGAHGRLAAWLSLGALVGASSDADIAGIEKLATAAGFLAFRARGPWFFDVAWDLGALALRPDGKTVAVLAATDAEDVLDDKA